jgi:hypothetical protein
MPQVTAQPIVASSYQPYISQQWTAGIPSEGQSQQHSQQPTMQNNSSRATSYTPFGSLPVVRPQHLPTGQDQGNYDSHFLPMASTQEQRRVSPRQELLHYGNSSSSPGQRHTVQIHSSLQTTPAHASGLSSHAMYMSRTPQYPQQSSSTQNVYLEAPGSQNQAAASGTTYSQASLPHKTTDAANHSQLVTTVTASRPVLWGPQSNALSSVSIPH